MAARNLSTPDRPIDATVIMPGTGSAVKRNATIGYGARVVPCASNARQQTCDDEMDKVSSLPFSRHSFPHEC